MRIPSPFLVSSIGSMVAVLNSNTLDVGPGKTYNTVGAAFNAALPGDTIYVYPGTYNEKIIINKKNITIKGSAYPSLNPSANQALITFATYASAVASNDASATLLITADNFKMYNMNVTNTAGNISQAVSLSSTGSHNAFYACGIKAYQDTLYAHSGSQFFSRCYIEGATDFIYGSSGNAWFQGCTIGVLKENSWVTAQGRSSSATEGFFVFDKAKIILGNGSESGVQGSQYLGRPWKDYARVVFQNSDFGNIINAGGWQAWNATQSTTNVLFAEYNNTNNSTDTGTRISWATKLSSPYIISTILPTSSNWVDALYLNLSPP